MCNNEKLKESMHRLSKVVFERYYNYIPSDTNKVGQIIDIMTYKLLENLIPNISELSEFKECLQILNTAPNFVFGALVGTRYSQSAVGDQQSCLHSFMKQLFIRSPNFDTVIFNEQYSLFENLIYDDNISIIDTCVLYNIICLRTIVFEPGITMKAAQFEDVFDMGMPYFSLRNPAIHSPNSTCVLKREFIVKKIVRTITGEGKLSEIEPLTQNEAEEFRSDLRFDDIVRSIRLLKASNVYRDNIVSSEIQCFFSHPGTTRTKQRLGDCGIGLPIALSDEDVEKALQLYKFLKNNSDKRLKVAIDRLCTGMERITKEDKVLDLMIGMEALYLPDDYQELTHKLSSRVALLLKTTSDERKTLFGFIKKMYNHRSKIVHGSPNTLSEHDADELETILRESIQKYIESPAQFSSTCFESLMFD